MSAFLHEARHGCCRWVLFYGPKRLTRQGVRHQLAVICDAPVARAGSSWCAAHATGLTEPPRADLGRFATADRRTVALSPRAETTPDLCEALS